MEEQVVQENLNTTETEIEEEEENYSVDEAGSVQDEESMSEDEDEDDNDDVPERNYVGGKAPRYASKAPRSYSSKKPSRSMHGVKSPIKRAIVKKNSRKTKRLNNNMKYQYMTDALIDAKKYSRTFFKITPLARIMKAHLEKISDESRSMRHRMDNGVSDEKVQDVRRITKPALERIRFYLENFSFNAFGYINIIANHGQRVTIMPKDIQLYRFIKNL